MALQERVAEAQRTAKLELKDLEDTKGGRGHKRGGDNHDDSEHFTGARKRMKPMGGGGKGGGSGGKKGFGKKNWSKGKQKR